ncbi:DUF551 domain-containing protein [Cupriavidus gilardii]|uniref:DUF551 domain-containing protein n=1 Tax=Cupriavidus gilardii TaxID=82541 RepID=UPI002B2B2574|nr:DUF551 domain-containing protein [Cupriavidus gilardii]
MDKEAVGMEQAEREAFEKWWFDSDSFEYGHTESAQSAWEAGRTALRAEHLAQQPAAQAAGLTDEGIVGIAELDGVATYETGWYRMTRAGLLAFARALLSRAAPSAQQAEPGSPMKAAADTLRRKAELEQAHQDGYRDGFKATQAMLDKAEQPAEEARGVDAHTHAKIVANCLMAAKQILGDHWNGACDDALTHADTLGALLAVPAAGTGECDATLVVPAPSRLRAIAGSGDVVAMSNALIHAANALAAPQAATGAQGLAWTSVNDRLPPLGTGERVLIYTEGADFAGEQFFDIKADDLYPTPDGEQDARTEVAAAATHWMPLPYPGITPNQKDA